MIWGIEAAQPTHTILFRARDSCADGAAREGVALVQAINAERCIAVNAMPCAQVGEEGVVKLLVADRGAVKAGQ
jgi:hypothetical protein